MGTSRHVYSTEVAIRGLRLLLELAGTDTDPSAFDSAAESILASHRHGLIPSFIVEEDGRLRIQREGPSASTTLVTRAVFEAMPVVAFPPIPGYGVQSPVRFDIGTPMGLSRPVWFTVAPEKEWMLLAILPE